jgi:hypothetical protein
MKIRELIKQLKKFDQDRVVVVSGYEGGYSDPIICEVFVVLGRSVRYEGDHSEPDSWDKEWETVCVGILRKNNE